MSRLAAWRRGPSDPVTARQWLFRWRNPAVTSKIDRRMGVRIGGIAVAVLFVGGVVVQISPQVAGPIAIAAIGITDMISRRKKQKKPQEKEPPGPGTAFEVGITVQDSHGLKTGSDRGWLIFSDGWILFEGDRTDFAITRGESFRRPRESSLVVKLEDGRSIVLWPLGEAPLPKRLNRAFATWEAAPVPDGEAVLPPRSVHPEILAERHTLWIYGTMAAAGVLLFGIALASWDTSALAIVALGLFLLGASICRRRLTESLPGLVAAAPPSAFIPTTVELTAERP